MRVRVSPTAPQRREENRKVFLFFFYLPLFSEMPAQRKIMVVFNFPCHRRKACIASGQQMVLWTFAVSEPFGIARAACFEELAGVFASSDALHYAKIFVSLKM